MLNNTEAIFPTSLTATPQAPQAPPIATAISATSKMKNSDATQRMISAANATSQFPNAAANNPTPAFLKFPHIALQLSHAALQLPQSAHQFTPVVQYAMDHAVDHAEDNTDYHPVSHPESNTADHTDSNNHAAADAVQLLDA